VDPGKYAVSSERSVVIMTNRGEAYARRAGARIRFRITRRLRPLDEREIDTACGPSWLRRSGCEEELELELDGACPVPVGLWSIAQAPPGSELSARQGPDGIRWLSCLQDGDSDHARLLVKTGEAAELVGPPAPPPASKGRPVELALVSPALAPARRRRPLRWKVSLYAFSGRSAEVRQLALRLGGTPPE